MNNTSTRKIKRRARQLLLLILICLLLCSRGVWAGQATMTTKTESTTSAGTKTSSKSTTTTGTKTSQTKTVKKVSGIALDHTRLVLSKKASRKLHAALSYKTVTVTKKKAAAIKANPPKIVWTSKNKKLATINAKGRITALKKGKTVIKATVKGTNLVARCTLIIGYPVTSITCAETEITLKEGDSTGLAVTVKPANASIMELSYTSSDPEIARVDAKGNITAVKAGKAVITVSSKDGSQKKASLTVTVNSILQGINKTEISEDFISPQSITLKEAPKQSKNARAFCEKLETYSAFLKANGAYFYKKSPADVTSYTAAQNAVKEIKKEEAAFVPSNLLEPEVFNYKRIGLNCASVAIWALKDMKYIPDNGNVYGSVNGFCFNSSKVRDTMAQYAEIMTVNPQWKLDIVSAANNNYLTPGDILSIAIGSINHTCIYAGKTNGKVMVYESGGIPYSNGYSKVGCGPLNYSSHTNYIVTGIIRIK